MKEELSEGLIDMTSSTVNQTSGAPTGMRSQYAVCGVLWAVLLFGPVLAWFALVAWVGA